VVVLSGCEGGEVPNLPNYYRVLSALFFLVWLCFDSVTTELYGLMYLRYVTIINIVPLYNYNTRDKLCTLSVAERVRLCCS
jgi:hypothetical protein